MKKSIFSYTAVCIILIGIITGCQKEIKKPDTDNEYNSASAKEWYYGTFKKSTEFSSYDQVQYGKKLPDWKNGVYKKFGNYEAIDFPLVKEKTFIPFAENDGLSEVDKKRIAAASISRITFIRDKKGRTEIRETIFIPDIDYLSRNGYDISNNKFGDVDKDFSGMILIKKWDNTNITRSIIRNGKVVQRYTGQPLLANRMSCNGTLVTEYFRDCEVNIYGDGMVTEECGPWMPTGNQWCLEDDPVPNPCEDPGSPQCACQEYGLCEGGGDDGGDEEPECSMTNEEAQALLSSMSITAVSDGSYTAGGESSPDGNGIIRKPVIVHRDGAVTNYGLGYSDRYELFFNGIIFKTNINSQWKWESISFDKISKVSGGPPPCISNSTSASVTGPIISGDKLSATYTASVTSTISITCLFGSEVDTETTVLTNTYYANSF